MTARTIPPATEPGSRAAPADRPGLYQRGRLAGVGAEELASFETPFYLYDLDVVELQVASLRGSLPARFDVAYAVKANPALAVVAFLGRLGLGADVASEGELESAARAGIAASRTVFTGPGKRDSEIAAAVKAGVRAITVESPGELDRVARAARAAGRRVPILLRLATDGGPGSDVYDIEAASRGRPLSGKFGMDGGDLRDAAVSAIQSPELELIGIHAFGHSNVLDPDRLADHVERTVDFAAALFGELGASLRLVDTGGGLGIPYGEGESPLDLGRLRRRFAALERGWAKRRELADLRIVIEPGRFLVGPAGAYVARVLEVKRVAGQRIAVTDGGIHHALRPALTGHGHRLRLLAADPPTASRAQAGDGGVLVAGPLCTSLDVLGRLTDGDPEPGNLIALLDVGAYGFTESMALFLSHPMPAELAVRAGRLETIRPSEAPASWLAGQRVPDW